MVKSNEFVGVDLKEAAKKATAAHKGNRSCEAKISADAMISF